MKMTKEILYKLIEEALDPHERVAKPDFAKPVSTLTLAKQVVGEKPALRLRTAGEKMLNDDFSQSKHINLSKSKTRSKWTTGWELRPTSQLVDEYIGILWNPKKLRFILRFIDTRRHSVRDKNYLDIVDYDKTAYSPEERLEIFIDDMRKQLQDWTKHW